MEKVNEGEHFRLSPEQFQEYFLNLNLNLNLEQHPMFTMVNAATRFAHFIIQNVIARHKNEVEDFGFQTVGKVKENIYNLCNMMLIPKSSHQMKSASQKKSVSYHFLSLFLDVG